MANLVLYAGLAYLAAMKIRVSSLGNSVLGRPRLGLAGLAYPKRKVPRVVIASRSCSPGVHPASGSCANTRIKTTRIVHIGLINISRSTMPSKHTSNVDLAEPTQYNV